MGLFGKAGKDAGWMAVGFQDDGIVVVRLRRPAPGRPVVELASFYPAMHAAVPAILREITRQAATSKMRCTHLLSTGEYQLLSVDAPNVPSAELKSAIRWTLRDMLDYAIDDATIDVLVPPRDPQAVSRSATVFAIAARSEFIAQRQKLFDTAKFNLQAIDIPEVAQRNIAVLLETADQALALLSIHADGGLITITFGGELYLSRRLDVTKLQLKQADLFQKAAIHERITLELQRSLDQFYRQYHSKSLSRLVMAQMGPDGADLRIFLAANLYIPVEMLDLDAILDLSAVPELRDTEVQKRYFMTIGAALRDEKHAP